MGAPMRCLAILLGAGAALALAGWSYERLAEARDRKRHPPPGRLIPVRGRRLHLHGTGDRRPGRPARPGRT